MPIGWYSFTAQEVALRHGKFQLETFKGQFHLLLLDLRDHGSSKKLNPVYRHYNFGVVINDVLKVLNHQGIMQAHFMTLSFGSVIVQALQNRFPYRVRKIVMAGAVLKGDWKLKAFVRVALLFNRFLSYRQMYETFSYVLMPKINHQRSRRIYRLQALKLAKEEYLKWLGIYDEFFGLLKQFFKKKQLSPCAVVMGEQDHVFVESARRYASVQRKASFIEIANAGHICNIDQPTDFNLKTLDFLLTTEKSQRTEDKSQEPDKQPIPVDA